MFIEINALHCKKYLPGYLSRDIISTFLRMSLQESVLNSAQGDLLRYENQIKSLNEELGTELLSQLDLEDQQEVIMS